MISTIPHYQVVKWVVVDWNLGCSCVYAVDMAYVCKVVVSVRMGCLVLVWPGVGYGVQHLLLSLE